MMRCSAFLCLFLAAWACACEGESATPHGNIAGEPDESASGSDSSSDAGAGTGDPESGRSGLAGSGPGASSGAGGVAGNGAAGRNAGGISGSGERAEQGGAAGAGASNSAPEGSVTVVVETSPCDENWGDDFECETELRDGVYHCVGVCPDAVVIERVRTEARSSALLAMCSGSEYQPLSARSAGLTLCGQVCAAGIPLGSTQIETLGAKSVKADCANGLMAKALAEGQCEGLSVTGASDLFGESLMACD